MSANTAELTLIVKAQNLAERELNSLRTSLGRVASTAKTVARDVGSAFLSMAGLLAQQVTNVVGDLFSGDKHHRLVADALALGVTVAGALVQGLSITLVPMLLERVFASAAFAPVAAALEAGGLTLGAVLSTAIAVGAAAFPFVLLGVVTAALVYLITNPEARQKAHDVAMKLLGWLGDGLRTLGKILGDLFSKGMAVVGEVVRRGVNAVVGFFLSIPDKVKGLWDQVVYNVKLNFFRIYYAVKKIVGQIVSAILSIPKAIGDALGSIVNLGNTRFQVVVPGTRVPRHAAGGWVGLNGPELGVLGEKGPEYIVPNHKLASMAAPTVHGVTIVGVTEREIVDMVDRGLYFKLRQSAPTAARV